jgi:hypothetical protein
MRMESPKTYSHNMSRYNTQMRLRVVITLIISIAVGLLVLVVAV